MTDKNEQRPSRQTEALQDALTPELEPSIAPIELDYESWAAEVGNAIIAHAAEHSYFDADDIRKLGLPEPRQRNWWGAVWRGLRSDGYITPIGWLRSTRPIANGGAHRLWTAASKQVQR